MLSTFNSFNENLNQARAVLRRKNLDEKNPEFVKIRQMLSRHLGYTGKFTKWHFEDGYSIERLEDLYKRLVGSNIDINQVQKPEDVIDLIVGNTAQQTINQVIGSIPSITRQNLKEYGVLDKIIDFVKGNLDKKDRFIRFFSKKGGTLDDHDEYGIIDILKNICDVDPDRMLKECRMNNLLFEDNKWIIFAAVNYDQCKKFGSKFWCIVDDRYTFNDYTYENDALQLIAYDKTKEIFVDKESVLGITVVINGDNDYSPKKKKDKTIHIEAAHWEDDSIGMTEAKNLIKNLKSSDIEKLMKSEEYVLGHPDKIRSIKLDSLIDFYKKNKISGSTLIESMISRNLEIDSFYFILEDPKLIIEFLKSVKKYDNGDIDDYIHDYGYRGRNNDDNKYHKFIDDYIDLEYADLFPTKLLLKYFMKDELPEDQINKIKIFKEDSIGDIFDYIDNGDMSVNNQLKVIEKLSHIIKSFDFKEMTMESLENMSYIIFSDLPKNYIDENIKLIKQISSNLNLKKEDMGDCYSRFIIFGDISTLNPNDLISLYKNTGLDISNRITSFNQHLFAEAVQKDDIVLIKKLLSLLPGNNKYSYVLKTK